MCKENLTNTLYINFALVHYGELRPVYAESLRFPESQPLSLSVHHTKCTQNSQPIKWNNSNIHFSRTINNKDPTVPTASIRIEGRNILYSDQQKSIGLKFSKSRNGSHVTYSYHHKSSRFTFPHICAFVVFLCLPSITINHTAYILTKDTNTVA